MSDQPSSINLIVRTGPHQGRLFTVRGRLHTIGRGPGNDIIIDEPSLSRRHARIRPLPDGFVVEDLSSTNGTFVNERRVAGSVRLRPGDSLRLGNVITLRVEPGQLDLDEMDTILPDDTVREWEVAPARRRWLWLGLVAAGVVLVAGVVWALASSLIERSSPAGITPEPAVAQGGSPTTAPSATPTPAPSATPVPVAVADTATPVQALTDTPSPPATPTPLPPTVAPSNTATPVPAATSTFARTATSSRTATPTQPATPTSMNTPAPTATSRPTGINASLQGKLAFSLVQGLSHKVYVVEVGPTAPADLFASIGNARQPALSHDGQWLLVNGTGGGIDAIARLTSAGHQAQAVTCAGTTAESSRPVWSPDNRLLAFDGVDPSRPEVYIQRLDTMDCDLVDNRLRVGAGDAVDANGLYPLWGPDERLYFRSCATWDPVGASDCGIWSVRQDGGGVRQLTDSPNHLPTAVNNERLLFMFNDGGNWDVYSVGVAGGTPQNLTNHPATDVWGTLSPDGRAIAFLSNRSGRWAIWLAGVDGSSAREWLPLQTDWGEIDPNQLPQERMSWSR
ncbi:MAG: FHA domain-containing protein [Anaerolineae bacterium]